MRWWKTLTSNKISVQKDAWVTNSPYCFFSSSVCLSGAGRLEAAVVTSVATGGWDLHAGLYSDLACQTRAPALIPAQPRRPGHLQHLRGSWSLRESQPSWVSAQYSVPSHSDSCVSCGLTCVCHSSLRRLDSWLVAAVDCLELFPDQLIVVASEQLIQQNATSGEGKHKRLLFDTIAKYYNSPERPPLLPGRYTDIHTGILQLLGDL